MVSVVEPSDPVVASEVALFVTSKESTVAVFVTVKSRLTVKSFPIVTSLGKPIVNVPLD